MKSCIANEIDFKQAISKTLRAALLTAALVHPVQADELAAPKVGAEIQAPAGNKAFLVARAVGTQNYICRPVGGAVKFMLFTPEAVLTEGGQQLTSHFFSPNPFEANGDPTVRSSHAIRPTWRHSRDTSMVWAKPVPNAVSAGAANAIPWLLLQVAGAQDGPGGAGTLTPTTYIQRVNTTGGLAPSEGCAAPGDVGNQAFVPYTADYVFFRKAAAEGR